MAISGVTYSDVAETLGRSLSTAEQSQATLWISDAEMLIAARFPDGQTLDFGRLNYVVRESVADRFSGGISGGAESVTVSTDDSSVTRRYTGGRGTSDGDWLIDGWVSLLSGRTKGGPFSITPWFDTSDAS